MLTPWKISYDKSRYHIEKQRHYFAKKGLPSQGYGFSSRHVWMWKLDCEESWSPKNWCFWTVVLEKTLESPLECKEIQPGLVKQISPRISLEVMMLTKAEIPVPWPPHVKSWLAGKNSDAGRDWGQKEKGTTEYEMPGWHHWLNGRESEWTPGVGDGQGGLVCCDSWGREELDTTQWLNWTGLVLLPGEFHGLRGLAAYSPWGLPRVGQDWVTNTPAVINYMTLGKVLSLSKS